MLQRNKSSNFSLLPEAHIQRSVFDRSSSHKFTFNVGELIPFYVDEVLPGSTHQIRTSKMVRLQTPATPFMDDLYLDTYYFFVPNRLIWDKWKEFQGENNTSKWIPNADYQVPDIRLPNVQDQVALFPIGSIADYMGLPSGNKTGSLELSDAGGVTVNFVPIYYNNSSSTTFNALPFRAYALICNDWFRDQNLSDPLWVPTGSGTETAIYDYSGAPVADMSFKNEQVLKRQALGGRPYQVCKYHDYFTSALPTPLKGEDVKVAVTTMSRTSTLSVKDNTTGTDYYIYRDTSGALVTTSTNNSHTNMVSINDVLTSQNAGISINDLRLAFATQAQYERDARGGTRYTEVLRSNFGVISPDASLQRSQYLGGNHFRINVNQVVQQSSGGASGSFLGDVAAFSATADSNGDFIQSFTEHGFIIGVCCARYNHSYQQGCERFWLRRKRFDYYMPAFANIGEQAIKYAEIYLDTSNTTHINPESVFGYQEAWAEYRMKPNRVSGEMRSQCVNTLDYWHLADKYDAPPYLSDGWIREDPNNVDRVLTVKHTVSNQIFADFYIDNKTTQPIPMYSIPATLGGNF